MMITMNLFRVFFILMCCYALFSTFRGSFRANCIEQFTTFEREFQFSSVQVSRFTFESRDSPKTLLHLGYVFRSILNFSGRSYFNSTLFTIALQESLSVHFVCFKICKLQLGYNQIKFVWFTFGSKDFPKFLYTWVTVSKMSNWNIKSHELLRKMYKAKQSQDRKRLKLVNVLITKETSC